jgi:DNA invertase Pin-like site-specific DNA recombinase
MIPMHTFCNTCGAKEIDATFQPIRPTSLLATHCLECHSQAIKRGLRERVQRGLCIGPIPKLSPDQREQVRALVSQGVSYRAIARQFSISPATVYRITQTNHSH